MRFREKLFIACCAGVAALLLVFQFHASAGSPLAAAQPALLQSNKQAGTSIKSFIVQMNHGAASCRAATGAEIPLTIPSADNRGVPISQLEPDVQLNAPITDASGGLTINLVALSQLQTDGNRNTVIAAFQRAANTWAARIKTPITITIKVDYGVNTPSGDAFPDEVVGSTGSGSVVVDYSLARANLIAGASSPAESAIYNSLPASTVPVNTGNGSAIEVTRSIGQAVGFVPLDPNTAVATISFNKNFPFDFNPDNGINSSQLDFVGTATHEIGHALGFVSDAGAGSSSPLTSWDLFRLRSGATPATFPTAQRIMNTSGTQVYYTTQNFILSGSNTNELGLSTGGPDGDAGDGNQSSHWKDDDLTGRYIGVMDPTIALGELMLTTENDFSAMEMLGWNLLGANAPPAPPSPTYNDDFANSFVLVGCSGTAVGTNLNATRESGEPNHLSLSNSGGGTHSIWYQWQAPSTGSVTFTTAGSAYDTVLGVYTGSSVNALTVVAQNDDIPDVQGQPHQVTSSVTFSVVSGNVYRIAVDGFNNGGDGGDMGPLKLSWTQGSCTEPARALITEQNTTAIAALDSVTFVGAPFHVVNGNNFSGDALTRVLFLIYGLGLTAADKPNIAVQAAGVTLTVENIGPFTGSGLSATYVIAQLPANMPQGNWPMTVTVRGTATSNNPLLSIAGP